PLVPIPWDRQYRNIAARHKVTPPVEKIEAFYNAALSSIHDSYFGQLALDSSSLIKRLLKDREPSNRYIVDLGCGSGILAKELSEQGFKVLGVDISEHML